MSGKKSAGRKKKRKSSVTSLGKPKRGKQRKGTKAILTLIIVLLAVIVVLIPVLLFQFGLFDNPFGDFGREPQLFRVEDECSLILGNLIHTVIDEGVCEQKCSSQCDVRGMEYVSSEFTQSLTDCHQCDCYCK